MATVVKKQICEQVATHHDLPQKDSHKIVDLVLETIINSVLAGDRVELRGFGVFSICTRKPHLGRNIRLKESIPIPARKIMKFRCTHKRFPIPVGANP